MEKIKIPGDWEDIQSVDIPFTFRVRSSQDGTFPYTVDLDSYDCNGACDCPDFKIRKEPLLARGVKLQLRCKHIRRAVAWFGEWSLRILSAEIERMAEKHRIKARSFGVRSADRERGTELGR